MKRIAAMLLMLLLLCGCGPSFAESGGSNPGHQAETQRAENDAVQTAPSAAQPASETVPISSDMSESSSDPVEPILHSKEEALEAGDCVLFFQQDQIRDSKLPEDHRGTLVRLDELRSWHAAQDYLPRTHYYDEDFQDLPLLLQILDYGLCHGFAGVTMPVRKGELKPISEKQLLDLYCSYRVDNAVPCTQLFFDNKGAVQFNSVWLILPNEASMARFSEALEKARQIVAEMPPELDEYESALYLYNYLKDHVKYDMLKQNYYNYDWFFLYDALVKGSCVCTGFSDALYYLFNLAGIDCVCLLGHVESTDFSEAQNHAWNAAMLYGRYYCFDVTWDTNLVNYSQNQYFAVSEEYLDSVSNRTYIALFERCYPRCGQSFRPPEEWNGTPEGALRAYLWLREYCCGLGSRLYLTQTEQIGASDPPLRVLRGQMMLYDLDYGSFVESFLPYITERCYQAEFEGKYYREEDGKTAVFSGAGTAVRYRIESVSGKGGCYTAKLISESGNRASAVFSVAAENGRFRIDTVLIKGS